MKISICYNPQIENSSQVLFEVEKLLKSNNVKYNILDIDNLKANSDIALVIGGDGTILKAARFFCEYDIPIFGINLGRLGFLSQASSNNLEKAIENILTHNYKIENRMMLKAENYNALNDFVIKGSTAGRTSRFSLIINEKFVCEYLADGIIISTPTGSTAYSMAAGGPIITPSLESIVIVPICPHTFSARPLVVDANDKIKIISAKGCVFADGQIAFDLKDNICITKSHKDARLILLNDNDFYSVLKNKLQWGISPVKM